MDIPAPEAPFRHTLPVQLRFSDIDMLGHVNNSVYIQLMDLAKADYLTSATDFRPAPGEITLAVVNINVDFFAPAYLRERLEVVSAVRAISERSIRLEQRVVNAEDGSVKCIARTVMAGFDPRTATGIPIPERFTAQVEAYEGRTLRLSR